MYIQRVQGAYWTSLSDSLHEKYDSLLADRGTLYSEDGDMLSTSIPYFNVYMDFGADGLREKNGKRFKENIDSLAYCLANLFKDQTTVAYKKELLQGYKDENRYFPLKLNLSFDQYKVMRSFPLIRLGRNKSGCIADVVSKRLNPFGLLANRTIGLARSNAQNIGLERTYDTVLRGQNGSRLVRYLAAGAYIPVEGYEIEPENGKDLITTLNVNTQDIAENALLKSLTENDADHGTCIVMEVATGKIRAMANLGRRPDGSYWEDYNYALRATEPGSTIKLATLLSVLSEGKTTLNDMVEVGSAGREFVGVRNVNDAERAPKPVMSVKECFEHSSNVGMSKIAYQAFATQPDKFLGYLHKYHFDSRTGIDLVGEERPVLPKIKRNHEGMSDMITMAFGYAIEVTPLQTLMLYNSIANDGKMMKPYLVNRVQSNGITIRDFEPQVVEPEVAVPSVIHAAQECMLAVTTDGTGKKAMQGALYRSGGKTGTAHVAGKNVGYADGVYQASFVGYFPFDRPKYSCIVVIKTKPHPAKHMGGEVSAPVFREIADKLYSADTLNKSVLNPVDLKRDSTVFYYSGNSKDMKNVMQTLAVNYTDSASKNEWARMFASTNSVVLNGENIHRQIVPDVKGMGLKDALFMLENMNMKVTVKGRGKVKMQSIEAGTALGKNQNIKLDLN